MCVLVARDDPLDTYLVHHPEALFGRPVEATVLDPSNPYVLGPHLCCAAAEMPLTDADLPLFGDAAAETIDRLVAGGYLRRRPTGWYWAGDGRPEVDLRGSGGAPISIVEESTGRLLGTVDGGASHVQVHTGAVHLHQGESYVVDSLDLDDCVALVHAEEPDWSTHARDVTSLTVDSIRSIVDAGPVGMFLGTVDVTNQVVSYQRRRIATGEIIDTRPLDLPSRQLRTTAVWWTISPAALAAAGVDPADVPGALHAAEHAAIGLLPLVATCDRWDIGGLSTALHADTEAPTVFVYDGHPGGAGFAERAYHVAAEWLHATREAIASCACEHGCPSCVQSPKCGNGNEPLSKDGAVQVLDAVLEAIGLAAPGRSGHARSRVGRTHPHRTRLCRIRLRRAGRLRPDPPPASWRSPRRPARPSPPPGRCRSGAPATGAAAVTIASSPSRRQPVMAAPFAATVDAAASHAVPRPSMTRSGGRERTEIGGRLRPVTGEDSTGCEHGGHPERGKRSRCAEHPHRRRAPVAHHGTGTEPGSIVAVLAAVTWNEPRWAPSGETRRVTVTSTDSAPGTIRTDAPRGARFVPAARPSPPRAATSAASRAASTHCTFARTASTAPSANVTISSNAGSATANSAVTPPRSSRARRRHAATT